MDEKEKLRKLLTEGDRRKREEEERLKRLGRVKVEGVPSVRYDKGAVDSIVKRMKGRYEDLGMEEAPRTGRSQELKERVAGTRALEIETRTVAELVHSKKPFPRLVGKLFSTMGFLNMFTNRIATYGVAKKLPHGLDSAYMEYSSKQYISVCLVASLLAGFFAFAFALILFLTALGPILDAQLISYSVPVESLKIVSLVLRLVLSVVSGFVGMLVAMLVSLTWPNSVARKRGKDIDKDLPFALRHMATEIKAGVGIHRTMKSIVEAEYGILSQEFSRALRDIDKGKSTEDALEAMAERVASDSLSRALFHMIRALKTGGNLSEIIESIAKDVSFDLRMKMRDFVERLNLIGLFYMMVGVVAPVFVAILAGIFNAIPTIGMAGVLGVEVLFLVYFMLIPMALGLILYIIKVMQPM